MERGKLIALEGIGGSGKSTIMPEVVARLVERGIRAWGTQEHTTGRIGRFLDDFVRGGNPSEIDATAVQMMFIADRIDHGREIRKQLENGAVVITDRYSGSTIAYGGVTEELKNLYIKMQERLMEIGLIVRPDFTVLIDVGAKTALERRGKRGKVGKDVFARMEKEGTVMVERYRDLSELLGWVKIDGEASVSEVTTELIGEIEARGWV